MYDNIELGPIDSIRVLRAERKISALVKKLSKSDKDGFIDFSEADELREDLLTKKKTRIATKDARKKYRELYGRKSDTISLDSFVKEYLEKNGLIRQALPEPKRLRLEFAESISVKDMKQHYTEKNNEIREQDTQPIQYEDDLAKDENIDLVSKKSILNNVYSIKTRNNSIGIEYYNARNGLARGYDTTRLIFGNEMKLDGHSVRSFRVSWYNAQEYIDDKKESINGEFNKYVPILAEIDINLLATNQDYASKVMSELLDKDRVISFVNRGAQDRPEVLNGRYIGGVRAVKDESPKIFFNANIGREAHELPEMIKERVINKIKETEASDPISIKRKEIEEAEKKLQKLREELDGMIKKQEENSKTEIITSEENKR